MSTAGIRQELLQAPARGRRPPAEWWRWRPGLRGTVGVTEQLSAGLPAGPLAAGSYPSWACPPPSRFCEVWVTCLLRCRQTSWNAPTFLCRTVPRQAPTQWARCRPSGLVVCGGWPLLSWWRLPVSPILQMGKQRPGSSVTQPGLWHLSCGAPGQEPVGTARGGGGRGRHSHCPLPTACRGEERPGCRPCPRSACHVGRGPGMAPQCHSRAWELRGPGNAEVGHPGCLVRSKPCPSIFQDKHHDAAHEIIETIR